MPYSRHTILSVHNHSTARSGVPFFASKFPEDFSTYIGFFAESQVMLELTTLVNPRTQTQPFCRHLNQRAFLDVLRRDIGEFIPAGAT